MKSFDEAVYCKTQEERDAIIDWVDTFFVQEGIHTFKTYFTKCANACVKFHSIDDLKYAFKEFYENNPQYDKIITFQQFKDKYMSASEVNSQSPSESVKVKSDGGIGMDENQLMRLKQNIVSFVNAVESIGGSPSVLLTKNIELLEVLARNGLKLTLTEEK